MSVYTPVVTPVVSSVGVDNPHYEAAFNGVDQYGSMAEWVPSGALYEITYDTDNEDGRIVDSPVSFPLSEIGLVGGLYHSGTISNLRLTSHTALQNVLALQGNGTDIYVGVPEIVLSGDFEIEFDIEGFAGSYIALLTSADDDARVARIGNGFVNAYAGSISLSGTTVVNDGGTYSVRISRLGETLSLSVDGVEESRWTTPDSLGDVSIGNLIKRGSQYSAGTIANLKITDHTLPDDANTYLYPLTYDINETDPTSKNIARQVGAVSGGDGTVYNATKSDYVRIEQNSRFYPMDEGSGAVCRDVLSGYGELYNGTVNLGAGWTDNGDGTYSCDGSNSSVSNLQQYISTTLTDGEIVVSVIEVIDRQAAGLKFLYGGSTPNSGDVIGEGVISDITTVVGNLVSAGVQAKAGFVGTVRMVSFKKTNAISLINSDSNTWSEA